MTELTLDRKQRQIYETYASLTIPRHTSYPPVPFWQESIGWQEQLQYLREFSEQGQQLSLYVHIPFCEKLCYYCGCSKVIRPKSDRSAGRRLDEYMDLLKREILAKSQAVSATKIMHIHFGGGTPTYLEKQHWIELWDLLHRTFNIDPEAEIAIEVDPRTVHQELLAFLKELGFNRLSLGIQDFDSQVQHAINRHQSFESIYQLMQDARALAFRSINFDLIYGLPFQNLNSLNQTIKKVIDLEPDRIAFYRLAVIPHLFKWQRRFKAQDLPTGQASLDLFLQALAQLGAAGYQYIGLDHFAKATDPLALAAKTHQLGRNFQGMTDYRDLSILAFGPSAISQIGEHYIQNPHDLRDYTRLIESGQITMKGCKLTKDDLIRRELIQDIYCYGQVDLADLARRWDLDWPSYFSETLQELKSLQQDGLLTIDQALIVEQPELGRLLRRVIATAFDAGVSLLDLKSGSTTYCGSTAG